MHSTGRQVIESVLRLRGSHSDWKRVGKGMLAFLQSGNSYEDNKTKAVESK